MSAASLSSSHFLGGLRISQTPRSAAASPPSPSLIRSAVASAAAAERRQATVAVSSPAFSTSLYEVLGVSRVASAQEIKAAYRRRARECHPDVIATGRKGTSADEFMRVHATYATLSEPRRREDYDYELAAAAAAAVFHQSAPALSSSPWVPAFARCTSFPGYGRRTWETDQCW